MLATAASISELWDEFIDGLGFRDLGLGSRV